MSDGTNMQLDPHTARLLKENPFFRELSGSQFIQLISVMQKKTVSQGEFIIHEGEVADELYIILQGEFEIMKKDPETQNRYRISTQGRGEIIGEVALLDGQPRSASVRALAGSVVMQLPFRALRSFACPENSLEANLKISVGKYLAKNLRHMNEKMVWSLRGQLAEATARAAAGRFISGLFITTCGYVFALQIISSFTRRLISSSIVTIPVILVFSAIFIRAIKKSGYPVSNYGLTTRNWQRSALEALLFSLPVFALIVIVKAILLQTYPDTQNEPLFSLMENIKTGGKGMWMEIIAYSIFSPFQEFITRGSVQSAFQDFLAGKHITARSILISNVLFSLMHLHLSVMFALFAFVPGLFWGWLFSRDRSLVGVSLSHVIIGLFALWVVGFDGIIR